MFRRLGMLLLLSVVGCQYINPIDSITQIGIYWLEGEAHKYYNSDQQTVQVALLGVFQDLKLPVIKEEKSGDTIYIRAGDDDRFKIKIHEVREKITKLSIRINTFGDKPYCEMIYRLVDKKGVEEFTSVKALNTALEERPRRRR